MHEKTIQEVQRNFKLAEIKYKAEMAQLLKKSALNSIERPKQPPNPPIPPSGSSTGGGDDESSEQNQADGFAIKEKRQGSDFDRSREAADGTFWAGVEKLLTKPNVWVHSLGTEFVLIMVTAFSALYGPKLVSKLSNFIDPNLSEETSTSTESEETPTKFELSVRASNNLDEPGYIGYTIEVVRQSDSDFKAVNYESSASAATLLAYVVSVGAISEYVQLKKEHCFPASAPSSSSNQDDSGGADIYV